MPGLIAGIRRDADLYERIDRPIGSNRFDRFLKRFGIVDVVVLHPVLLARMGRDGSDQADLEEVATAMESYLIRRMTRRFLMGRG
ncbi:hypothetical protein [Sphingomonas sp. TZW2008]|uniref:hypothetical protein n=1 Tax=Sphingomonas sp. TZW2008 TaxID=1917973 RepID=UPI000A26ECCF|nr:hypothetical protein [Sphingomonas sp. TZW2008]